MALPIFIRISTSNRRPSESSQSEEVQFWDGGGFLKP